MGEEKGGEGGRTSMAPSVFNIKPSEDNMHIAKFYSCESIYLFIYLLLSDLGTNSDIIYFLVYFAYQPK